MFYQLPAGLRGETQNTPGAEGAASVSLLLCTQPQHLQKAVLCSSMRLQSQRCSGQQSYVGKGLSSRQTCEEPRTNPKQNPVTHISESISKEHTHTQTRPSNWNCSAPPARAEDQLTLGPQLALPRDSAMHPASTCVSEDASPARTHLFSF